MRSPTGKNEIRQIDPHGSGAFASPRGNRLHYGEDWVIAPGERVFAPQSGKVNRIVQVYSDTIKYKGIEIVGENNISHIYYVFPIPGIVGKTVKAGDPIGYAQDIGKRYSGITNHVHWQIYTKPSRCVVEK